LPKIAPSRPSWYAARPSAFAFDPGTSIEGKRLGYTREAAQALPDAYKIFRLIEDQRRCAEDKR
jgi:hypothetical protein